MNGPHCKFNIGDKIWVYTHLVAFAHEDIEEHITRGEITRIFIEKCPVRDLEPTIHYNITFEDGKPHGLDNKPSEDKLFATKKDCITAHKKEHAGLLKKFRKEFLENREADIELALKMLRECNYDDLETIEKKVNRVNIRILDDTLEPRQVSDLDYALGIRPRIFLFPALRMSTR